MRYEDKPGSPPTPGFLEAKNRRQKAHAAGMHPDYWYPVERDKSLQRGQVREVRFWGKSFALYRDMQGALHALEDRCAHRQVKLSLGQVQGEKLVCMYHGWEYDCTGKVCAIPHDLFGKPFPQLKIQSFPVQSRYGLIWLFPGDPALAEERKVPEIPELSGPPEGRWGMLSIDFTWRAHHSLIIDNVSDFTHAYLHRRTKPFTDAKLTRLEALGDRVHVSYDTKVGRGRIAQMFMSGKDGQASDTDHVQLCYEYPFQWSDINGKIKQHAFVLPIDDKTTRTFFLFYFKLLKLPLLPTYLLSWLIDRLLTVADKLHITPLLVEDVFAVEAEQRGYNDHYDAPLAEPNPAVAQFQQLTIRKWEEYLAARQAQAQQAQLHTLRASSSSSR